MNKNFRSKVFGIVVCILVASGGPQIVGAETESRLMTYAPHSVASLELIEDLVFGNENLEGAFGRISDIAIDSNGNVYILDSGFMRIHKYSENGDYLESFGSEGEGPGEFRSPIAIDIGPDDSIFVGGTGSLVASFDPSGTPADSYRRSNKTVEFPVYSIAIDSLGYVYICSLNILDQTIIEKYSPGEFSMVDNFCDTYAVGKDVDTRAERAFAGGVMDIESTGEILYLQRSPPSIRVFDLEGNLIQRHNPRGWDIGDPELYVEGGRVSVLRPRIMGDSILSIDSDEYLVSTVEFLGNIDSEDIEINDLKVVLNLHRSDGQIVKTTSRSFPFLPRCIDSKRRVYIIEQRAKEGGEFPVVVRYVIG